MGKTILEKIIDSHLVEGTMKKGELLGVSVDQALLQDNNGPLALLELEAMGISQVNIPLAVAYLDHNTYQFDHRNSEDHAFMQSASQHFGIVFSRLGNGICHQVHREEFAVPGEIVLGTDSHTPHAGGVGMLGIGAGGLDVVTAMAGGEYWFKMPEQVNVVLKGRLSPWVTAKDIILALVKRMGLKGGVGKSLEFTGEGVKGLDISQRCTITNMSAEIGATTAIFPSDEMTLEYLKDSGRGSRWKEIYADQQAVYDDVIELDLSALEPMIALPSMPDQVVPVSQVEGRRVEQVIIGSCTNGSYRDILIAAMMLEGKRVDSGVDLIIAPASQQINYRIAKEGWNAKLMEAGANLTMSMCGACIGAGHVPAPDTVSLRTFNRNFKGRSGLPNDYVYLCSPEVAAASALTGRITDPRAFGDYPLGTYREKAEKQWTNGILFPKENREKVQIKKGENIVSLPDFSPFPENIHQPVLIKLGSNVTTDHIVPSSTEITIYRSNIPKLSQYTLSRVDPTFAERAIHSGGGIIVAEENYGIGSSREHAALCPRYLNIRVILAKTFARIHKANLINFGILPLEIISEEDYCDLTQGVELSIISIPEQLKQDYVKIQIVGSNKEIMTRHSLNEREKEIVLSGGILPFTKARNLTIQ